ncbi:MAG TPA: hypothetical protein V6C65_26915 [Allocoleopsis sp.]
MRLTIRIENDGTQSDGEILRQVSAYQISKIAVEMGCDEVAIEVGELKIPAFNPRNLYSEPGKVPKNQIRSFLTCGELVGVRSPSFWERN